MFESLSRHPNYHGMFIGVLPNLVELVLAYNYRSMIGALGDPNSDIWFIGENPRVEHITHYLNNGHRVQGKLGPMHPERVTAYDLQFERIRNIIDTLE